MVHKDESFNVSKSALGQLFCKFFAIAPVLQNYRLMFCRVFALISAIQQVAIDRLEALVLACI